MSRREIDPASFTRVAGKRHRRQVGPIAATLTDETERMKKYGVVIRMNDNAFVSLTKSIQKTKK